MNQPASSESRVWEQRWHPFREEWILFTSHRARRPWMGETKPFASKPGPSYDPTCYLCPGNERVAGRNPDYSGVYVFTNDLPTFAAGAPEAASGDALYRSWPSRGTAEVVCYTPDHSKTFADLSAGEALAVVEVWRDRYQQLGAQDAINQVMIFENKGAVVGTSNPHPHCQLYATNLVYGIIEREREAARRYHSPSGEFLGQAVLRREAASPRAIGENDGFLACVPWFARYAYEVLILPKVQVASLAGLTAEQTAELANIMREVCIRYDNLWKMPMPYVMAIHQAPTDGEDNSTFPFHIEYHPPLRSPDTLKYLAGSEIGGGLMTNESNPDEKAAELKAVSSRLYREDS